MALIRAGAKQGKKETMNTWWLNQDLQVNWIEAHNNHEGNKHADMLAKDGAMGLGNGPPIP